MRPAMSTPAADTLFGCSDEEMIKFLVNTVCGLNIPGTVITDVNPFDHTPRYLSDGNWYLIQSNDNETLCNESWKVKVEEKVFSNNVVTGWKTTLEFLEGPGDNISDWIMYKYWITKTSSGESNQMKKITSLCRILRRAEDVEQEQKIYYESTHSQFPISSLSSSKLEVTKDDDKCRAAKAERPPKYAGDTPNWDYVRREDYLELLDLDGPLSPSSSDDSSCVTVSSDEWFDSMALLRELECQHEMDANDKREPWKFKVHTSDNLNRLNAPQGSPGEAVTLGETKHQFLARGDSPLILRKDDAGTSNDKGDSGSSSSSSGGGKKSRMERLKSN